MAVHAESNIQLNTIPAQTSLLGGHFVYFQGNTSSGGNTPASANVIADSRYLSIPAQWGYNTHIGANGIKLRYNETTLSEWKTDRLTFYKPGTNNPSLELISGINTALNIYNPTNNTKTLGLDTSGLNFYGTSTSTPDVTLNADGLTLINGSIRGGIVGQDEFLYLSPQVFADEYEEYVLSEDTEVDETKVYYIRSGEEGAYIYTEVSEPTGNPQENEYYEIAHAPGTIPIDNYVKNNWRQIIGREFAVDTDGNLYANGANIININANNITSGSINSNVLKTNVVSAINATADKIDAKNINASQISVGNLSDGSNYSTTAQMNSAIGTAVDEIEIGGRNFLQNTDFIGWTNCGSGTVGTFNNGVFTYPTTTVDGWTEIRPNKNVKYDLVRNKTITLSAEVKATSGSVISVMMDPYVSTTVTEDRAKFRNVYLTPTGGGTSVATTTADGTWQKVYATVDITDAFFSSGSATVDFATCYFGARCARVNTNHVSYQLRHVQIELGNKATDWTPAPEDVTEYTDSAVDAITLKTGSQSGKIANFDASAYPALDIDAEIKPVQYNYYDSVWVAGAGKNLVRDGRFENASNAWTAWGSPTTREIVGIEGKPYLHIVSTSSDFEGYQQNETKRNGNGEVAAGETVTAQVKVRGASSYNFNVIGIHWRDSSGTIISQIWKGGSITTTEQTFSITATVPENAVAFNVMVGKGSSSTVAELWIRDVQIEKGETATSYVPWANSSSISGRTYAKLYMAGKNLLTDSANMTNWWKSSGATISGGVATLTGSTSNWDGAFGTPKFDPKFLDGTTKYVLSFDYNCTTSCALHVTVAGSYENVDSTSFSRTRYTSWQAPQPTLSSTGGEWQRFSLNARTIDVSQFNYGSGDVKSWFIQIYARSNVTLQIRNVQIEVGNSATAYDETDVTEYRTDFPETVYGGTLDVINGVLIVDTGYINVTSATFASTNNTDQTHKNAIFGISATNVKLQTNTSAHSGLICDKLTDVTWNAAYGEANECYGVFTYYTSTTYPIRFCLPKSLGITTLAQFNTWLTSVGGIQIAYPLATPRTYQLTPQQIMLLQGTNNIWCDTGDINIKYAIIADSAAEVLASPIDVASKVVTTYITDIDSNFGITIKPALKTGNDYLQMNSTDIRFVRNNVDVMNLTDSAFRIGIASSGHSTIKSDGLHLWTGTESTTTNEVAFFGATARVGKSASNHISIDATNGIQIFTGTESDSTNVAQFGSSIRIGTKNKARFLVNATSLQAYDSSNNKYFEMTNGGMSADLITSGKLSSANNKVYFDLDNNEIACSKIISAKVWESTTATICPCMIDISYPTTPYGGRFEAYATISNPDYPSYGIMIKPYSGQYPSSITCATQLDIKHTMTNNNDVQVSLADSGVGIFGGGTYANFSATSTSTSIGTNSSNSLYIMGAVNFQGSLEGHGGAIVLYNNFQAKGTKSRRVDTDNYQERLLYCYETPTPMFGDIGEAVIGEDGYCYIDLDDIFSETIFDKGEYQVFLQKEGQGDCWIIEKKQRYFIIQGTPNLKVAWELKAKQKGYHNIRLEQADLQLDEYEENIDEEIINFIEEQEDILYG